MANPGIAPPDPTTEIGQLRYILGDVDYVALVPPVSGQGDYEAFSDAELQALLDMSGGSFPTAVGYAYLKLAGLAAGQAIDWRSDDLRVNLSRTPDELRKIAQLWFDRGSAASGAVDIFELAPVRTGCGCRHHEYDRPYWPFGIMGCCPCVL